MSYLYHCTDNFFRELGIRITARQKLRSNINKVSNSKKELEEITYAVSHDLHEPMQKAQIFSSLITKNILTNLYRRVMKLLTGLIRSPNRFMVCSIIWYFIPSCLIQMKRLKISIKPGVQRCLS